MDRKLERMGEKYCFAMIVHNITLDLSRLDGVTNVEVHRDIRMTPDGFVEDQLVVHYDVGIYPTRGMQKIDYGPVLTEFLEGSRQSVRDGLLNPIWQRARRIKQGDFS